MGLVTIVNGGVGGTSMKEDVPCSPVSVCATVLYVGVACIAIELVCYLGWSVSLLLLSLIAFTMQ